jgi:hypothetical protein
MDLNTVEISLGIEENQLNGEASPSAVEPIEDPRSPENIARRKALKLVERDALGRLLPGSPGPPNGGRPPGPTVVTLARTYTDAAVKLLGKAIEDDKVPMAARITAAAALLDRGWGKAPVQIDIQVRAKFDDFLREVGLEAQWVRDHPALPAVIEDVISDEIEGEGPKEGETDCLDAQSETDCDAQ